MTNLTKSPDTSSVLDRLSAREREEWAKAKEPMTLRDKIKFGAAIGGTAVLLAIGIREIGESAADSPTVATIDATTQVFEVPMNEDNLALTPTEILEKYAAVVTSDGVSEAQRMADDKRQFEAAYPELAGKGTFIFAVIDGKNKYAGFDIDPGNLVESAEV